MFTKFLYYFLSIIGLLAAAAFAAKYVYPRESEQFWWDARLVGREFWYGKDLSFAGLSRLQPEDLEVRLPMDRSVLWWNINSASVEASIRAHPLVEYAEVRRCGGVSFRCFNISITERVPRYIVEIGGQRWLVGVDGGFMTTVAPNEGLPNMVLIEGLGDASSSPDIVKGRFEQLRQALSIIERYAARPIIKVDFQSNLEFLVSFAGLPFPVLFDMSNDGELIPVEARRLQRLLEEFAGRLTGIKRVDLSYNKMAVVQIDQERAVAGQAEKPKGH